MPPKAMVSSGLIRRISFAAAMIMLANIFQSGSTLKSQCERLFGSFHSIMASTIASLMSLTFTVWNGLQRALKLAVQDISAASYNFSRTANPCLRFGMSLDLQTRTSQHRLNSRPVWDPPVRGIVRVALFNEIHRGKIALFKNTGIPEGIIFGPF